MKAIRAGVVVLIAALAACGPNLEGFDPETGEGVQKVQQSLVVDDLYNKLREVEGLLSQPLPSQQVEVGTLDAASGMFSGLQTSYSIDPISRKPRANTP